MSAGDYATIVVSTASAVFIILGAIGFYRISRQLEAE